MTKQELLEKLIKKNVPKDLYSLDGGLPNEAYCLEKTDDGWQTYYSERGCKTGVKKFSNESDACDDFYRNFE